MIRSIFATTAAVVLCAAIAAHVAGFDGAAETCGSVSFLLLTGAVIAPPRAGEGGHDAPD